MSDVNPRIGIGVFVFKDGKFLMGKRKGAHGEGSWSVPGGHLDFGESIEEGARRETEEETGVRVNDLKIVGFTNDIFKKEKKHYVTFWVIGRYMKGNPRITEPDKFIEIGWFDFKNLPKPLFLPWKKLLKSDFISKIKNPKF